MAAQPSSGDEVGQDLLAKRNFYFGVLNGALFFGVLPLLNPGDFISLLTNELTGSSVAVGLVSSLYMLGGLLPQVVLAKYLEPLPRLKQLYALSGVLRVISLIAIALSLALMPPNIAMFWAVASLLLCFSLSQGLGNIPFMDLMANTIPKKDLGAFFGLRGFYGNMLGVGAGLLAGYVLNPRSGLSFPKNYLVLFLVALVGTALGIVAFLMCKEAPRTPTKRKQRGLVQYLKRSKRLLLRDRDFILLVAYQALGATAAMASAFFLVYGVAVLGISTSLAAVCIVVRSVSNILSNLVWIRVGNWRGNRMLLILTAGFRFLAPLVAVFAPLVAKRGLDMPLLGGVQVNQVFFLGAFVAQGFFENGSRIGSQTYLLEIASERRRPTYLGFLYTLLAPFTLVPLLGGLLAQAFSYTLVFIVSMAFASMALIVGVIMSEPRENGSNGMRNHGGS